MALRRQGAEQVPVGQVLLRQQKGGLHAVEGGEQVPGGPAVKEEVDLLPLRRLDGGIGNGGVVGAGRGDGPAPLGPLVVAVPGGSPAGPQEPSGPSAATGRTWRSIWGEAGAWSSCRTCSGAWKRAATASAPGV